jgi:Kef-type K+ transport system membrane component KefB/nucleotide-binding universal stress UspA family protein
MLPLYVIDYSLPLKNPVLLFSLILFIILFAPILLNKLRIPHLIGLIIAGAIIGPNGLNLMLRDSSIILFGTVGLLYIMFLAGLEIDLNDFKKNSGKSLVFGLYTFIIPMSLGIFAGIHLLHFSMPTSILLASMFASHTLIAYPIISKLGVAKNRAVNITVGGTLITDTLALLVLAVIVGMSAGDISGAFWIRLSISVLVFGAVIMLGFPLVGRWFFKNFEDNISQYIFVIGMVFLGGFLAEAAGIEAIIGAFLAGLALNRLIPHTSGLMNRIEFVGNALFIPFFLIGVGMLIDFRAFFKDFDTIRVALVMTGCATLAKYLAAWLTQKTFRFTRDERRVIFGLSNAQAAATLAAVLVGYQIILNQPAIDAAALLGEVVAPVRLLNESVLNGTILMILVTCTIGSFAAQKGAQNIAISEAAAEPESDRESDERILIPINDSATTLEMVNLSLTIKSKRNRTGLYALHVIEEGTTDPSSEKNAHKILEKAAKTAAATDNHVHELMRYDVNIINGILSVVKEQKITDIILGLSPKKDLTRTFLGSLTEGILAKANTTTLIYKSVQPLSTIKRHIIVIPERAEREIGFLFWVVKVWNIARNTGAKLVFYGAPQTLEYLQDIHSRHPVDATFESFADWDDFLILARDIRPDDNLIIVLSRRDRPSYNNNMRRIPNYLDKYFKANNFVLIYPAQTGVSGQTNIDLRNPSMLETLKDNLDRLDEFGNSIVNLFRRK